MHIYCLLVNVSHSIKRLNIKIINYLSVSRQMRYEVPSLYILFKFIAINFLIRNDFWSLTSSISLALVTSCHHQSQHEIGLICYALMFVFLLWSKFCFFVIWLIFWCNYIFLVRENVFFSFFMLDRVKCDNQKWKVTK